MNSINSKSPNIVFITCDQLRADVLGCYGSHQAKTPNIDALAARGTVFDNAYVSSPVCAPNRASWATGQYPSAHGLSTNGIALDTASQTFMECLRRSGYQTAVAGKLHFKPQWSHARGDPSFATDVVSGKGADDPQPRPWDFPYYGFEQCALTEDHNAGSYASYLEANNYDPWQDPHSASYPQHVTQRSHVPVEHSKTNWITDRSIEFVDGFDHDRPFMLWTSYVHPHHPFVVPAPYDEMFKADQMDLPAWDEAAIEKWPEAYRAKYFAEGTGHEAIGMHKLADEDFLKIRAFYYGMVAHIDKQIGRLIHQLNTMPSDRETIIVFSSDHGEMLGDQHLLFKATHYRCVTRVPLVITLANQKGKRCNSLTSAVDIMPTILEMAGVASPSGLQGQSILRCVTNSDHTLREGVYVENPDCIRSYITDKARLSWHGPSAQGELYRFENDPHELRNLWGASDAAMLKHEMMESLLNALVTEAPIPQRRVAYF